MRFKTDENLPQELAQLLRDAGWDCLSAQEQRLGGATDARIAQVCREEGRILLTLDVGFANIQAYPPSDHPGFIVFRLLRQDTTHVLNVAARLTRALRVDPFERQLWIVEEDRIRRRS